ncbi:MAG: phage holin family protein [Caulobacteraceae bacterium]|nr:phage holin family protein [Caulobacteraceae bacterium]
MSMPGSDTRSLPELISALTGDLANLVRKESELVRTEISEKLHQTTRAGGVIAIGGVLLLGAEGVFLAMLVLLLSKVMDPVLACLLVTVVVGVAGYVMVKKGIDQLGPKALIPDRSARQLNKDAQLVKEQVK